MTIIELLEAIGIDNLKVQLLGECLTGNQTAIKNKKGRYEPSGARLTFGTPESLGAVCVDGTRDALIVWFDTDKMKTVLAKFDKAKAPELKVGKEVIVVKKPRAAKKRSKKV